MTPGEIMGWSLCATIVGFGLYGAIATLAYHLKREFRK